MVRFSNGRSKAAPVGDRLRRRADARRIEILRAAARVFRTHGFASAGMRDIAIAADLSPANLYHYFRGKDEILYFCQDRSLDRLLDALSEARRGPGPLPDRLRALAAAHVRCLVDALEGSAAHLEVDALPPARRRSIVAKRDRYERGVRTLVAAGMACGQLRRGDATIATRALLGALNWTAHWYRPEGPRTADDVATLVADYAIGGLTDARSRPHPAPGERRAGRRRVRVLQDAPRGAA